MWDKISEGNLKCCASYFGIRAGTRGGTHRFKVGQCSNTADSATSKISTEVAQEIMHNHVNLHCGVRGVGDSEGERMTVILK